MFNSDKEIHCSILSRFRCICWVFAAGFAVLSSGFSAGGFAQESGAAVDIGIEEKLGNHVPLSLILRDETGVETTLGELIDRPTILSLVYYRCPGICSPLMSGIAEVLSKLDLDPTKDFLVLTVSFDPTESSDLARDKKVNYLKAIGSTDFPAEGWRFLTGDSTSIATLTDAVGFRYRKEGKDFLHTASLIVLSPEGKVARYVNGITFLPFEIKMALLEASQGRTGPTISKVLLYCFSYDPEGRRYVFNILKVSGTVILFFAGVFISFLIFGGRKKVKE